MSRLKSDCSTLEGVRQAVREIAASVGDDEVAHSMEDDLRQLVLLHVVAGHPDAKAMAMAALSTSALEFQRWCA